MRQGDMRPALEWTAPVPCDGTAIDFTLWTELTFRMVGPRIVENDDDVTGSALGVLTYEWQDDDTTAPGTYGATFTGLDEDGNRQTFPTEGEIQIEITPTLGG